MWSTDTAWTSGPRSARSRGSLEVRATPASLSTPFLSDVTAMSRIPQIWRASR
jgi:hypothetical protein